MILKILCLSLLLVSASNTHISSGKDWELRINKNGIAVYTKSVPGSDVKAVKSVCTVNSTLSGITALILDVPSYHNWIYRCARTQVLKKESSSELIYYQETSVPWPASNRDFIGKLKITQDKSSGIVTATVTNMPEFIAEKSGKVRLKNYHEKILITPKGAGKQEISYELQLDPGGNIPAWMINLAITEGPYDTSLEMMKLAGSSAYKNTKLDFIKEVN